MSPLPPPPPPNQRPRCAVWRQSEHELDMVVVDKITRIKLRAPVILGPESYERAIWQVEIFDDGGNSTTREYFTREYLKDTEPIGDVLQAYRLARDDALASCRFLIEQINGYAAVIPRQAVAARVEPPAPRVQPPTQYNPHQIPESLQTFQRDVQSIGAVVAGRSVFDQDEELPPWSSGPRRPVKMPPGWER